MPADGGALRQKNGLSGPVTWVMLGVIMVIAPFGVFKATFTEAPCLAWDAGVVPGVVAFAADLWWSCLLVRGSVPGVVRKRRHGRVRIARGRRTALLVP